MSNPNLQSVIDKIKKLQALAKNNTNVNEMQAAAAAADKLLQEYRITQAEVEVQTSSNEEPFTKQKVSEGGKRSVWREILLSGICAHYGCAFYYMSHRVVDTNKNNVSGTRGKQSYTVVGRQSDVEIVQYFFSWLEQETLHLCKIASHGNGRAYAKSWLVGCAQGVSQQLADLREKMRQEAGHSTAMVILDRRADESKKAMEKMENTTKGKYIAIPNASNLGKIDGYIKGKSMHLRQGMGDGSSNEPKKLK